MQLSQSFNKYMLAITPLLLAALIAPAFVTTAHAQPPLAIKKPSRSQAPNELLINLKPGQGASDIAAIAAKLNATVIKAYPLHNLYRLKTSAGISPAQAKSILATASNGLGQNLGAKVSNIQPNFVYTALDTTPNDPLFYLQYSLYNDGTIFSGSKAGADVKAKPAWDLWTGSSDVYVADIDTGIDYTHPDLVDNVWVNPGETGIDEWGTDKATNGIDDDGDGYVDDVHGINAAYDPVYYPYPLPGDPYDDNFHGTHTAGTIGASGNNGLGVTGVNWNVKIIALKFLNSGGSGYTSDAVECLDYLHYLKTVKGLNIIASNNSWGGGGFDQALYDAIKQSGDDGILFIAAAGNSGVDTDALPFYGYPASFDLDNIISVAATDYSDQLASFSNYGKTTVDLGAPGVAILSTIPTWYQYYGYDIYYFLDGTSMATPHVTGAAALLHGYDPSLTAAQIKKRLMDTGDPVGVLKATTVSGRRLNLYNLLTGYVPPVPVPDGKVYVDVTLDSPYYYVGWTYTLVAYVHDNTGSPLSGASVKIKVTNPKGVSFVYLGTSGANGRVQFSKPISRFDGPGTFKVNVTATKDGKTGQANTTFVVY